MQKFLELYKNKILTTLLIAVIINIIVMTFLDLSLKNESCKYGIISFELAKQLDKSVIILNSWSTNAKLIASLSLGFDFLFLIIYSSFIALLIFIINNNLWQNKLFYQIGNLLIKSIFIAALFDIIENIALIKLLLGNLDQVWSSIAFYFAFFKFIIIIFCIMYIIINGFTFLFKKKS